MKKLFFVLLSIFLVTNCVGAKKCSRLVLVRHRQNICIEEYTHPKRMPDIYCYSNYEEIYDKQEVKKLSAKLFEYSVIETLPGIPVFEVKHLDQEDLQEIKGVLHIIWQKEVQRSTFGFINKNLKKRKYDQLFSAITAMQKELQNLVQKKDFWQNGSVAIKFHAQTKDEQNILVFYEALKNFVKLFNEACGTKYSVAPITMKSLVKRSIKAKVN